MTPDSRKQLRKQLRNARRGLSRAEQKNASKRLARRLGQSALFLRSRHIAFYLAADGEIDPAPLMSRCRRLLKQCYLPVLNRWPSTRMSFQRLLPGQRWTRNRYGIREPLLNRRLQVKPWRLGLVLMPLVGFDAQGNRLGMGGGFYDRAFAYRHRRNTWRSPALIGLAHDCQKTRSLPTASWDIPLDGIVTDQEQLMLRPHLKCWAEYQG
ncbi:5-formyltetrahydrofolate cyclo-ligase [Pseudomonas sp. 5Ae-yellow]|uniref:5-formyltetrahydrofolate cyclo-ligase n=1 Tax=Pseudomonas sp. 5Ae-yellow TaxID=2759848 RepID=UPI0015F492CC|nr:5-formyltetrahydrofolate cyclo-ligase [Pseudomonas sp. 5Ae-yellow]MBA6418371.1 5-formyltetrahydrofolate cyclo-ligase [Pseudomonas sp. 5Ae-yellow]